MISLYLNSNFFYNFGIEYLKNLIVLTPQSKIVSFEQRDSIPNKERTGKILILGTKKKKKQKKKLCYR
jgi:hypothetical protein